MPVNDRIRPATAERENVIALLGVGLSEGRLDAVEFEERVQLALAATSHAELGHLLVDLPAPVERVAEPAEPPRRRRWAVAAHLLGLLTQFLGPLLIARGDRDRYTREHALEAANFQLSVLLASLAVPFVAIPTMGFGLLLWIPIAVGWLWCSIAGALAAGRGAAYRYPLNLRLIGR